MSVCFVCCRVFSGAGGEKEMWRHVTTVHVDKEPPAHVCKQCGTGFRRRHHLTRHIHHKHSLGPPRECRECGRKLRSDVSLRVHLSAAHGLFASGNPIGEKKHSCGLCGQRFGIPEENQRHQYYCKKKLKLKRRAAKKVARIQAREERRAKEKERGGTEPDQALFIIKEEEQDRILGEQQFPEEASSSKSAINVLVRQKLDKTCIYCELRCASMQSLRRHIQRKHPEMVTEAEKMGKQYAAIDAPHLPFACLDCGRRVANRTSLSIHRRRVHELRLDHNCEICGKSYPLASELRKHMKRVHGKPSGTVTEEGPRVEEDHGLEEPGHNLLEKCDPPLLSNLLSDFVKEEVEL